MTIRSIITIISLLCSVLTAYKSFIEKPKIKKSRTGWFIGFGVSIILPLIQIYYIFYPTNPKDTAQDHRMDSLECSMDTLKALINSRYNNPDDDVLKQETSKQAQCLNSKFILLSSLDSAIVLIGLEQYSKALIHLRYAILTASYDTAKGIAYFYQGVAYDLWGKELRLAGISDSADNKQNMALTSLDSSISYIPCFSEALNSRAVVYFHLGKNEKAIRDYDSAIKCDTLYGGAWINRGIALTKMHKNAEAISSYNKALILRDDFSKDFISKIWVSKCEVFIDMSFKNRQFLDSARFSIDSALSISHKTPEVWYYRAMVYFLSDSIGWAIVACDSSLKYNSNYSPAIKLKEMFVPK